MSRLGSGACMTRAHVNAAQRLPIIRVRPLVHHHHSDIGSAAICVGCGSREAGSRVGEWVVAGGRSPIVVEVAAGQRAKLLVGLKFHSANGALLLVRSLATRAHLPSLPARSWRVAYIHPSISACSLSHFSLLAPVGSAGLPGAHACRSDTESGLLTGENGLQTVRQWSAIAVSGGLLA